MTHRRLLPARSRRIPRQSQGECVDQVIDPARTPTKDWLDRLDDGPVAVRSSALGEASEGASFAGQYETVLSVRGPAAVEAALEKCLASLANERAGAYRESQGEEAATLQMSVVIQQMVDAAAAGVCFTADPVTSRRGLAVVDAVAGLGESLVSGSASPDHHRFRKDRGEWLSPELAGAAPVLDEEALAAIIAPALEAEARLGEPLDLEWALDREGSVHWLQARPITTLGPDPQALDTRPPADDDVFTRCNVGEMMPGAVSPLTFSTCARGIDVGWQNNQIRVGTRDRVSDENVYISMFHGHLFINLSEGARFSAKVMGSDPDQQSLAICGRIVPEVKAPPIAPLHLRLPRLLRQLRLVLGAKGHIRVMEAALSRLTSLSGSDAADTWRRIDYAMPTLFDAYARHLSTSSGAGALAPILLRILSGGEEPSEAHHAEVAGLLAGAEDVESADIASGADRIVDELVRVAGSREGFADAAPESALGWIRSDAAGPAGEAFAFYLLRHGHRSVRELDIRQPEWAADPLPVIRTLQAQLRARHQRSGAGPAGEAGARPNPGHAELLADKPFLVRKLVPVAHRAVRNRERGKSLLVNATSHFKRAYRTLGAQLAAAGSLPDADAVYFLFHEELGELVSADDARRQALAALAVGRREALAQQETLRFPEVFVGVGEPERPGPVDGDARTVVGKPVSRGRVRGRVRVVHELAEAEALEAGEILVTPITDVGWTPYFGVIAGLVTNVGSAVSHGAVVAREYGLPAVLNTRVGTEVLRTGEWVTVDGDRGVVEREGAESA